MAFLNRRTLVRALALTLATAGLVGAAQAQSIDDIKKRGVLRVGILADLPPWGFVGRDGKAAGYDADVANLLGKKLGVPVEFSGTTSAARTALLMTGKVDVLIATVGMYPDRAKVVQFSKPYGTLGITVIGKKSLPVKSMEDLANYRVGVSRSSIMDNAITAGAPKSATIQRFDDEATSIQALVSGQVDLIGGNTTYFQNINKAVPNHSFEHKFFITRQYMGVAMRPGQKQLNEYVNAFVDEIKANGELNAIYRKTIGEDMPELPEKIDGVPFTVQ
ncbi:transporter substrate-binding domain-containing protein [Hydrogenophaga sp.]|uniref:transporter substrate-binding domain-containing protein n=1 Tax=Hydrogenophaga sp. TaxID=1904254 RepID=UPI002605D179|nr:transporter substrate-binding domain-containing protein [Hydrogenophaga sp.]MCW5655384.1 transporter substrate-binding domain-containing protein [Hydrogenophaga sp.]